MFCKRFFLITACLAAFAFTAQAHASEDKQQNRPAYLDEFDGLPEGILLPTSDQFQRDEPDTAPPPMPYLTHEVPDHLKNPNANGQTTNTRRALSMQEIVLLYKKGEYKRIIKDLAIMAQNEQHEAEELLGIMYMNEQGVKKDLDTSFKLLEQAAEAGRPLAQHYFGILSFQGTPKNPPNVISALMWLQIAMLHYPEGSKEKKRAETDREAIYMKATRLEKTRADEMTRDWLSRHSKLHLLDLQ
ncbi:MAG: hypothetical protein OXT65_11270 [Alphaproteobacteria bacterium]|nr:hypothetical protein [Alphaproteobacteria bacterium]